MRRFLDCQSRRCGGKIFHMPRSPRIIVADWCYHFINRANRKAEIFHSAADYDAFLDLVGQAQLRTTVPILAYCLMPNHVHFVVRPNSAADLTQWAHWLFTSHAHRYHSRHESTGHVWQGRFKTFAIQSDQHLLTVLRYVERNALAGKLVGRAEDWRWGSLHWRKRNHPPLTLSACPVELPGYWNDYVNQAQTAVELAEIRTCVNRQRPFGAKEWVDEAVQRLQNDQSIDPIGRPRKRKPGTVS
jgi:putative transposase